MVLFLLFFVHRTPWILNIEQWSALGVRVFVNKKVRIKKYQIDKNVNNETWFCLVRSHFITVYVTILINECIR